MKRCCTCNTEKPETEYSRNKSKSDGLQPRCKACAIAYHEANREKIADHKRAYRKANREKIAECERAYREANREKIAERQRAWRESNPEKVAEHRLAYRDANREKIAEREREYRSVNREKLLERKREYRSANRAKISERMRTYMQKQRDALSGGYIKSLIADTLKTSMSKVPPKLVELKRQHLTLHRAVRNLEGAISEKRNQNHGPTSRNAGRRGQASDGW